MQVLDEESKAYFNFINSLNSESTRNSYKFCLQKFLIYYKLDLASFLQLPTEEMSNFMIKYLVDKKIKTIQESCNGLILILYNSGMLFY